MSLLLSVSLSKRYYCFQGSSLYQLQNVDCGDLNADTDEWYCSTMTVCETDINNGRDCILTRGCATRAECINPETGNIYNNDHVMVNSSRPAGMKIYADCCRAKKFADDDALAIDMGDICNSAGRTSVGFMSVVLMSVMALGLAIM